MQYRYCDELISDMHKEARGIRPTRGFMMMWNDLQPHQKEEVWVMLEEEQKINAKIDQEREAKNLDLFREEIRKTMDTLMCDWKQAVEKLAMHQENLDIPKNGYQELEHFLFCKGLGWDDNIKIQKHYLGEI